MSVPLSGRARRLAAVAQRLATGSTLLQRGNFVTSAPSPQTAIDAVSTQWGSKFPGSLSTLRAGEATLFEDPRMRWAFDQLGGMEGKTVLDLGPLEGGHSYMAQDAGATRVVGVEANQNAFLKCLITKELLALDRCTFLCGDVTQYLSTEKEAFDVCIASGILYHMANPVQLIDLIAQHASCMIMWTHIYSDEALQNRQLAARLSAPHDASYRGFSHRLYRHNYGLDNRLAGFFGGTASFSNWLPREDLWRALDHFGWRNVEIAFDEPFHQNGPSLALVATRDRET